MSSAHELRQLIRQKEREGWTVEKTRGRHLRWRYGDATPVISGSTPSDYRGFKNLLARLKRIEQGEVECVLAFIHTYH